MTGAWGLGRLDYKLFNRRQMRLSSYLRPLFDNIGSLVDSTRYAVFTE